MSDNLIKREDAIKAIEELPNAYNGWSDAYDKAYIIGTLEEVPKADRPQEWIPCSERLPIEYEVLCCDIYKNCIVGHPFADDSASTGFCAESEGEFLYECIAWMPLPKPWKGADDE